MHKFNDRTRKFSTRKMLSNFEDKITDCFRPKKKLSDLFLLDLEWRGWR